MYRSTRYRSIKVQPRRIIYDSAYQTAFKYTDSRAVQLTKCSENVLDAKSVISVVVLFEVLVLLFFKDEKTFSVSRWVIKF